MAQKHEAALVPGKAAFVLAVAVQRAPVDMGQCGTGHCTSSVPEAVVAR